MLKKPTQPVQPDSSKILLHDPIEVKYWVRHLKISQDDLQRLVEKVGNSVAAVRKELDAQISDIDKV